MGSTIIEQDFPHDIMHRGESDMHRHNKRVNDAVRKQIKDIIGQHDIITQQGNQKVKVRLKNLNQYRWIHNRDRIDNVGRDEFDDLTEGEIIARPSSGGSKPVNAGDADGEEIYEAEYTMEELTDIMLSELKLPDLDDTKQNEIVSEAIEWDDIQKNHGASSNIDKKRTIKSYLLRKSKQKVTGKTYFANDDRRFRVWNIVEQKHSNAVIFLMLDRSGSMWEEKIYLVKAFYFWIVQFLRRKYQNVEIKFIAHDYNAKEMTEKEFFTISDSGGTRVSSAYELCRDLIKYHYAKDMWNIYCFHASDGDSWSDESYCITLVKEILGLGAKLFAYTEINIDDQPHNPNADADDNSELMNQFLSLMKKESSVLVSTISERSDILESLKLFLKYSTLEVQHA